MNRIRLLAATAAMLLLAAPSLRAVPVVTIGDTKLNLYGWVWIYGSYYADALEEQSGYAGSLFYNYTGTGPLDTHALPDHQLVFATQPTRVGIATTTPSSNLGDVSTQIEYDLNGSNSNLRQANIQIGDWTFGRCWTLWGDPNAFPITIDWNGVVGQPSWITGRPIGIKYTHKIDARNSWGISLEQNPNYAWTVGSSSKASADMKVPSIVGAWSYIDTWGHISLHGLGAVLRHLRPRHVQRFQEKIWQHGVRVHGVRRFPPQPQGRFPVQLLRG
jgi:hypothetical protein